MHRKPTHGLAKKIATIQADRNSHESLKPALAGRTFHVVYDDVYDWEYGTTAASR